MAKRFTDSDKWRDPWFRKLKPKLKCFWFYLVDSCDMAGIWKVDLELASFVIGESFTDKEVFDAFNGRIKDLGNGRWIVTKFIEFQYGKLKEDCRPHQAVISCLRANGIEYGKEPNPPSKRFTKPTPEEVTAYAKSINYPLDGEKFCAFYDSKGWVVGKTPMKNWRQCVVTWKKKDIDEGKLVEKKPHTCPHCGSKDFDTKLMQCLACNKLA